MLAPLHYGYTVKLTPCVNNKLYVNMAISWKVVRPAAEDAVAVEDSEAVGSQAEDSVAVEDSEAVGSQAEDSVAVEGSEAVEDSEAVGSQVEGGWVAAAAAAVVAKVVRPAAAVDSTVAVVR